MADIIILALVLGYCIYLIIHKVKQLKDPDHCNGICTGCSGCNASHIKEDYFADQLKEKRG